ncbi:hypothetical protein BGZ75_004329 [Mortierella antarctica]|nr:hypothetical protein BGZ75_004329 [Mortierella antarctica]
MEVAQPSNQQPTASASAPAAAKASDVKAPMLAMTFPHVHGASSSTATGIATHDATATADSTASIAGGTVPVASFSKHPVLDKEGSADMHEPNSLSQESNTNSRQTNESAVKPEDEPDSALQRNERQRSKEKMIEHVLQQGKILKVSRRLRTRLEYAILKIRRGWSKYTLQEVESLIQPSMSPRLNPKRPLSTSASPRQSERKRVRKEYPEYEQLPTHRRQTSPTEAAAGRRYKARPSFSQFKDSELFLPAKSLMDIATSSPSPSPGPTSEGSYLYAHQPYQQYGAHSPVGYGSPSPLYGSSGTPASNWSSYSLPSSPVTSASSMMQDHDQDRDDRNGVPSDAQAARTILLLASSPTRPTPRTLDRNYLMNRDRLQHTPSRSPSASPVMHNSELLSAASAHSAAPYSPMTSSPLVQFQTTAASSPSPDRSPAASNKGSVMRDDDNPFMAKRSTKRPPKETHANLYGSKYEPLAPSSLSGSVTHSTLLSPIEDEYPSKHIKTSSRDSSPTPRHTARARGEADRTNVSEGQSDQNTTMDTIIPQLQRGTTIVKEEGSRSPHSSAPSTPPHQMEAARSMRTPPPSGGKEGIAGHYDPSNSPKSIAKSIAARRRNSGLAGGTGTDLVTVFPKAP